MPSEREREQPMIPPRPPPVERFAGTQLDRSADTWVLAFTLILLAVLLFGGIAWGLKLGYRIDETGARLTEIDRQLAHGILPLAEERIERLRSEMQKMMNEINAQRIELQRANLELSALKSRRR